MSTTVKTGWLKDAQGNKFAPKTLMSQIYDGDGSSFEEYIDQKISEIEGGGAVTLQPLTFSGAVSAVYDGTAPIEVMIPSGESEIEVDAELSSTSENPVQNKVVSEAINNLNTLVGDTEVSTQISNAISQIDYPVDSVNGKTGVVQLTASDVGALGFIDMISNRNDDFNNCTQFGYYLINNSGTLQHAPASNGYGVLQVYKNIYATQVAYYNNGSIWHRSGTSVDSMCASSWTRVDAGASLPTSGGTVNGTLNVFGMFITNNLNYGTSLPTAGQAGRIFFKKV